MNDAEILELIAWVSREARSYPEAIEVWRPTVRGTRCGRTRSLTG